MAACEGTWVVAPVLSDRAPARSLGEMGVMEVGRLQSSHAPGCVQHWQALAISDGTWPWLPEASALTQHVQEADRPEAHQTQAFEDFA